MTNTVKLIFIASVALESNNKKKTFDAKILRLEFSSRRNYPLSYNYLI